MPKQITAYADNKGTIHKTAREATLSDLSKLFGANGGDNDMSLGIAATVFENRVAIEQLFKEHDATQGESCGTV